MQENCSFCDSVCGYLFTIAWWQKRFEDNFRWGLCNFSLFRFSLYLKGQCILISFLVWGKFPTLSRGGKARKRGGN